jgi:hypothetical protein
MDKRFKRFVLTLQPHYITTVYPTNLVRKSIHHADGNTECRGIGASESAVRNDSSVDVNNQ